MPTPDCTYFEDSIEDWACREFCPVCMNDCSDCVTYKTEQKLLKELHTRLVDQACQSVDCIHTHCKGLLLAADVILKPRKVEANEH